MLYIAFVGGPRNDTMVECALLFGIIVTAAATIAVDSGIVARCGIGCAFLSIKISCWKNTSMYIAML